MSKGPSKRRYTKLKEVKQRADRKKISFNLTTAWYTEKSKQTYCEETGLQFKTYKGRRHPFGPSIHRDNNDKGYTEDNCKLVANIFNIAKADFTREELDAWLAAFVKVYEEENMI